jgi:hypothetical protein
MMIPLDPPAVASPFAALVLAAIDPLVTLKEYTQPMVVLLAQVLPPVVTIPVLPLLCTLTNIQSTELLKISETGEHAGSILLLVLFVSTGPDLDAPIAPPVMGI